MAKSLKAYRRKIKMGIFPLCGICGIEIQRADDIQSPGNLTIDHIIPLSRGGSKKRLNTQPAHQKCNVDKGGIILHKNLMYHRGMYRDDEEAD